MATTRKTIILERTGSGWTATEPGNAELIRLFGTDTLPTPFTASATSDVVLADIQARNPDAYVCLRSV